MSGSGVAMAAGTSGWRVRLPATRAEAEAIPFADDAFPDREPPPTLLTDEPDPGRPDDWTLDAYFADAPTDDDLARLYALVPAAAPGSATVEPLADADWVTLSQSGFAPVRAGRFVVHTAAHAAAVRPGDIGIAIEAGLAFGTGQHFTTHGCLAALDGLAKTHRFARAADLGTGTGVLAIAIARAWPRATVVASDIDPVATRVARANLSANGIARGRGAGAIDLVTAPGAKHPRLRGPFDLVTANILAGPLVAMAASVAATVAPGGVLVLAGLLTSQARRVAVAYTARGFRLVDRLDHGEWPTLVLRRGQRPAPHTVRVEAIACPAAATVRGLCGTLCAARIKPLRRFPATPPRRSPRSRVPPPWSPSTPPRARR